MEIRPNTTETLRYQDLLIDRTLAQDITQELSLPDYQPEIKRLLRVSATVQPPTRYIGGGNIEFSGNVDFNILYAGEDGALYCFPTSADYTLRTAADGENTLSYLPDENMTCYALIEPDLVNGRVAGPRKLTVRCRMRAHVRAWGGSSPEEIWTGKLCGTPQRLRTELTVARVLNGTGAPLQVSDEILLERASESDDTRIVTAEACVLPEEITTAADRVSCRGQLCLKLLLQRDVRESDAETTEPMLPTVISRKIPFTADIPVEGLLPGGEAVVQGSCTELNLILEDGKILCEAELLLDARTQHRESLSYTADLCCIGQHTTVETSAEHACRPVRCINTNFSQNETLAAKETSLPTAARLADVHGTVLPDSIALTSEGSRCVVSGTCRYSLIYLSDGELASRELELPFRYTLDMGQTPAGGESAIAYDHSVRIVNCKARLDERDGRLNIDAELCLSLRLWENVTFYPVATVKVDAPCQTPVGSRTIYYPLPGETLWSVAKRYCSSVEQLSTKNHLPAAIRADDPASLGGAHIVVI
ncbi:MAG: hypothetical protein IJW40_09960 [Clostridia bacterium]|nr:hypothetical protein [Clostridia bacterium]